MRYDYWVVRYVPDAIRGEFVNIAVIAGAGNDWSVRRVSDLRRASRLGGSATMASPMLNRIEHQISAQLEHVSSLVPSSSARLFTRGDVEDLRTRMNNVVQISDARPVIAASSKDAVSMAFELMIVDQGHEVHPRSRTKVVKELASAFDLSPDLVDRVATAQTATVGRQQSRFDFVLNAHEDNGVRQLSQVWGFDLKSLNDLQRNIRSWNYVVGLVRRDGGLIEGDGLRRGGRRTLQIPYDVPINAVYTAPRTAEGHDELAIALDGWDRLGIEPIPADEYQRVVEQAEALV